MPLYTADALILRTYKLGEADRIVIFLTADRGKRRGVANGARRPKSKFAGGLEPLTLGRVAYFEREQRELVRLQYVEPTCSPLKRSTEEALAHVSYFAELLDELTLDADPADALFRLGASVVEATTTGGPVERLARYFEYWVLRLQGVYPATARCSRCGRTLTNGAQMVPAAGTLECSGCKSPEYGVELSAEALDFLQKAKTIRPGQLGDIVLSTQGVRQLASVHRLLIKAHLDKELKSARVLRELTDGQVS
jgi:DNA repair protein RecO (recombination protein O)